MANVNTLLDGDVTFELYLRVLLPGLRDLDPKLPAVFAERRPLTQASRRFDAALDRLIVDARLTPEM